MKRDPMSTIHLTLAVTLFAAPLSWSNPSSVAPAPGERDWTIRAETIYTATGDPIRNGSIRVKDGHIASVGVGGGGTLTAFAVTPGLIDLSVRINLGTTSVEQSTETPVEFDVLDGIDLYSTRWERELRNGVTSVLVTPLDRAVIGGLAGVIKTGGAQTLEARLVKRGAALRGSSGSEPSRGNMPPRGRSPSSYYFRRPTTRMGVEWVFRKSFYDALASISSGDASPGDQILGSVLRGERPLVIQAWATQDIRTAVYLKEEFGIPRMIVDAAAEAWREPGLLVRSGMDVILPPFEFDGYAPSDGAFMAWDTAAKLDGQGVRIALSGHGDGRLERRLCNQPALAQRGGLSFDAALRAVTINPARMVGIDDRVGSIEKGKDADLVLWNGTPFLPTSRIIGVLLDGELVLDPRTDG